MRNGSQKARFGIYSINGLRRESCMSGDVTEVLAGFAASLQYDDLPGHVRDHCKNVLLDTLACAVAGHRGEETQQLAALASGLAQSDESSVIGGDRLSLAGATILNGYLVTAVTMCDVHRSTLTHVTPEVIPPALGDRRTRRFVGPRPPGRHRRRMRGDDADRHRPRLSCVPGQGLARSGRARSVRRRRGRRPAAPVRHRDHGEGVRPRRQPGGRHLRGVGNADGEVPSVPRRSLRADGGAAGRAEVSGDARISDRQGRRPLQCLCERRPPRGGHRRSRQTLGARADRVASVAVRLVDPGHEHRDVRSHRAAQDRSRPRKESPRGLEPAGVRSARQAGAVQGEVRRADFRPLHRGRDPA